MSEMFIRLPQTSLGLGEENISWPRIWKHLLGTVC